MAGCIKLLPEFVANQIAAGEVVNRPSSVVKEMMENAVDAGAKNITVNFRDGGKAMIQIIDDGVGMSPIDARLAFDRHATSKINAVDDIYHLGTFGFRGEALASIASVAEVQLRTRQEDDELGTQVEINGGKFVGQTQVNCPVGSQFTVKNLFYNVPARRRFLDRSSTESRHIVAEYQRVALCNPEIGFTLYDSDALVSKLVPSGLRQRVVGVIGKNIAKNLLDVDASTSIVRVEGFAGRPASARQTNKEQFLFVNGRYFKSPYFHKAVVSAYEKLVAANTQPSYFIYLTVDSARIDVNVHPQKTEIKFEDGTEIWQILNAAVREALAKSGAVPPMDFDMDTSVEIPVFRPGTTYRQPEIKANPEFNPFEKYPDAIDGGRRSRADLSDFTEPRRAWMESEEEDYGASVLEFISGEDPEQELFEVERKAGGILPVGTRYAATVVDGVLMIVDLHRAFESVLYDRYSMMLESGNSVSQQLLFPEALTLSLDDAALLKQHIADFTAFGFDVALRDEHTAEVSGLPADLASHGAQELVYDLLDVLREESEATGELRRSRLAASMARKGSYSKTRTMSQEEIAALLDSLSSCANPSYTPSGNPIMTVLTEDEIVRRLKK